MQESPDYDLPKWTWIPVYNYNLSHKTGRMKKRDKSTMFYMSQLHTSYIYIYVCVYIYIFVDDIGECQKNVQCPQAQSCLRTAQMRLRHTPHVTLIQMKFKIQCIRFLKYLYNYVIMLIADNSQESSDILSQVAQL